MKVTVTDTLQMTVAERIRLVTEIWESVALVPEQVDVTPETMELVRRRLAAHRKDPSSAAPWSAVRARILKS